MSSVSQGNSVDSSFSYFLYISKNVLCLIAFFSGNEVLASWDPASSYEDIIF